jgi:hypothetical protein
LGIRDWSCGPEASTWYIRGNAGRRVTEIDDSEAGDMRGGVAKYLISVGTKA